MNVTVKVIGPLIRVAGFEERAVRLPADATAGDVLDHAGIPRARPTIVTRNGHAVSAGDAVAEGDRIVVSPIYSGG